MNTKENLEKDPLELKYMDSVHKAGRIWGLILFVLIVSFPLLMCIIFKAVPNWNGLLKGMIATCPMYWAVGLIELFTYIPMLGSGGTYLSFVTGNISNLKLPCALNALDQYGVKASSEEGEIVSTIAIAVSSIVTTVIIIIGVVLMGVVNLDGILRNDVIKPAFDQMLPALFGALGVVFISKNVKLALPSILLMIVLFICIPALNSSTVGIMVPVGVVITIIYGRIMYKKGKI